MCKMVEKKKTRILVSSKSDYESKLDDGLGQPSEVFFLFPLI